MTLLSTDRKDVALSERSQDMHSGILCAFPSSGGRGTIRSLKSDAATYINSPTWSWVAFIPLSMCILFFAQKTKRFMDRKCKAVIIGIWDYHRIWPVCYKNDFNWLQSWIGKILKKSRNKAISGLLPSGKLISILSNLIEWNSLVKSVAIALLGLGA